jgi:hypothetical protein
MDQWDLTGYYYGASGFVGSIQDYWTYLTALNHQVFVTYLTKKI